MAQTLRRATFDTRECLAHVDATDARKQYSRGQVQGVASPAIHGLHFEKVAALLLPSLCKKRLEPRPGRIYASGVIGDGKLYYDSRENDVYVLAAEPRYRLLAHNTIATDESIFNATPTISRKQLLLRSDAYLYCIGAT